MEHPSTRCWWYGDETMTWKEIDEIRAMASKMFGREVSREEQLNMAQLTAATRKMMKGASDAMMRVICEVNMPEALEALYQ